MKKIISLLPILLLIIVGCEQEPSLDSNLENLVFEKPNPEGIYTFGSSENTQPFEALEFNFNPNHVDDIVINRNPNTHVRGNFTGYTLTSPEDPRFYKSMSITFNALENSQGTNGNANFKRTWGENGENEWKFNASAQQLFVDGNDAVYCGMVYQESGPRPFDIVGAKIWFRVIDGNGGTDQYYDIMFFNASGEFPCTFFAPGGPGGILWPLAGPIRDVEHPRDRIDID